MAKEKKVTLRDKLQNELAQLIMQERDHVFIDRTKEGLVVQFGDETLVVRVVHKKGIIERKDVVEQIAKADIKYEVLLTEAEQMEAEHAEQERQQKMIEEYGPSLPKQEGA